MLKRLGMRIVRSTVATGAAVLTAKLNGDPRYVFLAPLVQALGKAIREWFPKVVPWLPF